MPKNRKKAESTCLDMLRQLCPGSDNVKMYEQLFAQMSDKDFDRFIEKLRSGKVILPYIEPNLSKSPRVSVKQNLSFLKKYNRPVFQKVWMTNSDGSRTLSSYPYMVVPLPLRRQAQLLVKKISIPKSNRVVDDLTAQPTGQSKGSKISYPQQGVLYTLGLHKCLEEFNYYRSGDIGGYAAMNDALLKTGSVAMKDIADKRTGVEAVKTWSVFLKGAHLGNNLVE